MMSAPASPAGPPASLAVPSAAPTGARWEFAAIGTHWCLDTAVPLETAVRDAVGGVIDRFDREWSRFRPDSVVSALAPMGGVVRAPADAAAMFEVYAAASDATDGAVNPLIGAALARRGYDAASSLIDGGAEPAPAHWRELLSWSRGELALTGPALIDVGALGKGRLVDLVAGVLTEASAGPFVVDASGDLAVRGLTERIGLEHPYDPTRAIGVWEVTDAALCASATNRRAWSGGGIGGGIGAGIGAAGGGLHHVLDARTGEPVRTVVATWAVASDAMTADAAATALFFAGGDAFAAAHDVEWVRMNTDGRVEWSPKCEAELFT